MGDLIRQRLLVPRLLTDAHVRGDFQCGHASLDQWLLRRALMNQATGSSRTYVVTTHGELVVGYYSIAPTSLEPADFVASPTLPLLMTAQLPRLTSSPPPPSS